MGTTRGESAIGVAASLATSAGSVDPTFFERNVDAGGHMDSSHATLQQ